MNESPPAVLLSDALHTSAAAMQAKIHPNGWGRKKGFLKLPAIAPTAVALVGNIGCYLIAAWMLSTMHPEGDSQSDDWRVTSAAILVGVQALWLTWIRTRTFSTTVGSLFLWGLAMLVAGHEPLMLQPGMLFAMFVFAREHRGVGRAVFVTIATVGVAGVFIYSGRNLAGSSAPAWDHPASLAFNLAVAIVTVTVPAMVGVWYARLQRSAERVAVLARETLSTEPARTANAVAAERRILASELHDATSAHLASVLAISTTAERTSPPAAATMFRDIREEGHQLYTSIEAIISRLKQPDRTLTGVAKPRVGQHNIVEVEELIADHRLKTGTVDYFCDPSLGEIDSRLGPMRSHIAYRVIQEALSNVRKHAAGSNVQLSLEDDGSFLWIWVENTSPDQAPGSAHQSLAVNGTGVSLGYGLDGMRDRLAAAGATLRTGPRHEGGWSVTVQLPHPQHRSPTDTANFEEPQ